MTLFRAYVKMRMKMNWNLQRRQVQLTLSLSCLHFIPHKRGFSIASSSQPHTHLPRNSSRNYTLPYPLRIFQLLQVVFVFCPLKNSTFLKTGPNSASNYAFFYCTSTSTIPKQPLICSMRTLSFLEIPPTHTTHFCRVQPSFPNFFGVQFLLVYNLSIAIREREWERRVEDGDDVI